MLNRYFIGTSMCFLFFVSSLFMVWRVSSDWSSFALLYIIILYSMPLVYTITLITFVAYLIIKKYISSWNYVVHCGLFGVLFSKLFGLYFFEESITHWIQNPISYIIVIASLFFAVGKFIPSKQVFLPLSLFPFLAFFLTLIYPLI
jgi:hypothetical protein